MGSGFDEVWGEVRAEATERVVKGAAAPQGPGSAGLSAAGEGHSGPGHAGPGFAGPVDDMSAQAVWEAREAVLERLADFRSRAALVPLDSAGGLWTADFGGVGWICAFSDEAALARFAESRGEESVEWPYRRVLGSRLLDEVVPAVGFPCGVALDAGSPGGAMFPPVKGIVPDRAALDADENRAGGHGGERS
ncbi:hypothetical protein ACIGEZ_30610 [Streptomyces sp. NPDC085481]|uniref:hypothetical protein n=1 Tax=Streptomyces sp. NPDC085481 TaxID=3365727 RepID=UPI0037D4C524